MGQMETVSTHPLRPGVLLPGGASRPLRVLFVEDSALDCELLVLEMERQGFAVTHERVEFPDEMRRALDGATWDLVLADFQLPAFSGVAALAVLHERGQDLPFILVSGSMGDCAVAEAMRAGAHDYIEKDHLTRLGPAIERELREAQVRCELRRALQDVRDGAERLKLAASASNTGLWDWNLATNEVFFSPEWKAQLGYKDDELASVFTEWEQRLHPEDREMTLAKVREHFAQPATRYEVEARLRHRDGSWRWIRSIGQVLPDDAGRPARMLGSHQDITQSKQLEADYLRVQRVESIGSLAGSVAHDLNNILAPILMASALLRDEMTNKVAEQMLMNVETCAQRGADLVKQLLTFARGRDGQKVLLQPRHLLHELVPLLPGLFSKKCKINTAFASDLWIVEGDVTQIHQVLLNLCVNARDAMPNGGTLTLTAANAQVDEAFATMQPGAHFGPHVCFEVADTGTGIAPEHLDKLFEPFFTTKEPGRGTGLGLATVQTIVRSHGGFVQLQSKVGRGTTFKIFLPAKPEAKLENPVGSSKAVQRGQGELVLVTDDDEALREVICRSLESHGYKVLTAGDGTEGLTLFLQHRGEIRLVITDVMMPFLDGVAFVRALRKIEPEARIVASSGIDLSEDAGGPRRELAALGVSAFLQKPYHSAKLFRLVRELIDAPVHRVKRAHTSPGGILAIRGIPTAAVPPLASEKSPALSGLAPEPVLGAT